MLRALRLAIALCLGGMLLAGCAQSAPAHSSSSGTARPLLGVDVGWVVANSGQIIMTPQVADHVAAAGAQLARVEFRSSPFIAGACAFTAAICSQETAVATAQMYKTYDQVVANLTAKHIQILGLLDYTTLAGGQAAWTANNAENGLGTGSNPYTEQFAQTAEQIMAHYQGKIHLWEIWNEPNAWTKSEGATTYSGGSFMYPSNYAALLKETYQAAVVQHHLPVTLISGGLFGQSIQGVYSRSGAGATYLSSVFSYWKKAGMTHFPLDAIGEHLYITQGSSVTTAQVQQYLNWVHQVAVGYGDPTLPTYITEMGWKRGPVTPQLQASNLQVALAAAHAESYVHGVIVFNLTGLGYGIYSSSFTPEPSLTVFQAAAKLWATGPA